MTLSEEERQAILEKAKRIRDQIAQSQTSREEAAAAPAKRPSGLRRLLGRFGRNRGAEQAYEVVGPTPEQGGPSPEEIQAVAEAMASNPEEPAPVPDAVASPDAAEPAPEDVAAVLEDAAESPCAELPDESFEESFRGPLEEVSGEPAGGPSEELIPDDVEVISQLERKELKLREEAWAIRLQLRKLRHTDTLTPDERKPLEDRYNEINAMLGTPPLSESSFCSRPVLAPLEDDEPPPRIA